jgi:hypothetical protein
LVPGRFLVLDVPAKASVVAVQALDGTAAADIQEED